VNNIDWPRIQAFLASLAVQASLILQAVGTSIKGFFKRRWVRISLWTLAVLTVIFAGLQVTGHAMVAKRWQAWPDTLKSSLSQIRSAKPIKDPSQYFLSLEKKLKGLAPKGMYILIDTALNRLTLHKGKELLHQAVVSCGSGNILDDLDGSRTWVFDTPRGIFSIQYKLKEPVWIKPDWAFIEEGTPIPKSQRDRVETGVLGDYALGFGDGFFIHGTLYTRLLGRSVTHGCVRVGDKDLETIYKKVPIGTPIYIF
jgi:L,D-transpeptidase YbiS